MSRKRNDRPGRLAVVYWVDIQSQAGWEDSLAPKLELCRCVDVGWIVARDADGITLVRSIAVIGTNDQHAGDCARIPRSCVCKITYLSEPRVTVPWKK